MADSLRAILNDNPDMTSHTLLDSSQGGIIASQMVSAKPCVHKGNEPARATLSSLAEKLHSSLPSFTPVYHFLIIVCSCVFVKHLFLGKRHRFLDNQERASAKAKPKGLPRETIINAHDVSKGESIKEVRIFMDGAFDLMHYGHMNAFRLARSLGTHLVAGVNSDASIIACKGAPLMNDQERLSMVESCKFVDEVVTECPYIMTDDYLEHIIEKYDIDYVVHGDDPCCVNGKDVYAAAKRSGKYRTIPRTEGVSTTYIIGRMLLLDSPPQESTSSELALFGRQSKFFTTSRLLHLFSAGAKSPKKGQRVIYMDGAWDMFHCGHVAILKAAKKVSPYRTNLLH